MPNSKAKVVCKLQKALYGLKQSPRAWFGRLSLAMKKYGFQQSNSDHTLFLKRRQGRVTALIVYVDEMIITGSIQYWHTVISIYLQHPITEQNTDNAGEIKGQGEDS